MKRRKFIQHSTLAAAGLSIGAWTCHSPAAQSQAGTSQPSNGELFFKISLAQWSLHRTLWSKQLDNLDFAATARNTYGIEAIEYVNQFFKDKAKDQAYLTEMKKRADDNGVRSLLIMIDGEGGLAETDDALRRQSVENHYKWVDAAAFLGCHSIRVNAYSSNPDPVAAASAATDGLGQLADFAAKANINVIVENHGGFSSNGEWLSGVMELAARSNLGTLPDFGNFCIRRESKDGNPWSGPCVEEYDRYKGVRELMPWAKGVSAKSYDFDQAGNCIETDYERMLKIVKDAGYNGYIGIEYEGSKLSEDEGIRKTKALLERVGATLGK